MFNFIHFFVEHYWATKENQRKVFEEFAANSKFDPLLVKNWYSTNIKNVLSHKVIRLFKFGFPYFIPIFTLLPC